MAFDDFFSQHLCHLVLQLISVAENAGAQLAHINNDDISRHVQSMVTKTLKNGTVV